MIGSYTGGTRRVVDALEFALQRDDTMFETLLPHASEANRPMTLYLDTARMGRFGDRSQVAVADFLRFHSQEGSSVHFDDLLRWGFHGAAPKLLDDYCGLRDWEGIQGLKESIRRLGGASFDSDVLFAASSAQLLRIAAKAMFEICENVFTLDIAWPDYQKWLRAEAELSGHRIAELAVCDQILHFHVSKTHLLEQIVESYNEQRCDGLFLPAVNNLGIRLPYTEIIQAIRNTRPIRFVVIDGAQDFCHIPTALSESGVDLYVTGCHKWMQAYLPMRLGICCSRKSRALVSKACENMFERRLIDDPLLRFTRQLERDEFDLFTETANLIPMFSCAAAVAEQLHSRTTLAERLGIQLNNARQLDLISARASWRILAPDQAFRSGVVLMESRDTAVCCLEPDEIRRRFREWDVCLSAYHGGIIRLSMPTRPWSDDELNMLSDALAAFDEPKRHLSGFQTRPRHVSQRSTTWDRRPLETTSTSTERWAVPVSSQPCHVGDERLVRTGRKITSAFGVKGS